MEVIWLLYSSRYWLTSYGYTERSLRRFRDPEHGGLINGHLGYDDVQGTQFVMVLYRMGVFCRRPNWLTAPSGTSVLMFGEMTYQETLRWLDICRTNPCKYL